MEILAGPLIEARADVATLGIRTVVPFRGMLGARDRLLDELVAWLDDHDVAVAGHFFLRLHVIDMGGPMDVEVGVTDIGHAGDERVHPGVLPAGRYVTLTYRDHSMRANKALLEWAREEGHTLDRTTIPEGDLFVCRCETYLTDPRTERRKTRWDVQLSIRLAG